MSESNVTLAMVSEGWQTYQNRLSEALAPLFLDQLALCSDINPTPTNITTIATIVNTVTLSPASATPRHTATIGLT